MGLDMYLDKKIYISEFRNNANLIDPILKMVGATDESGNYKHISVIVPAIYWWKANSIHKWFVDNVQDGKDDCGEYEVDISQLEELLELVEKQLKEKRKKKPKIFLAPTDGFFFGNTKIDEWYWGDLERTATELKREIENARVKSNWYFTYHSSW